MTFSAWIEKNHNQLQKITRGITKDPDEADDLYSSVVEQLLKKKSKLNDIPDNQKKYYFIKVLKLNYHSRTSPYHYEYRKPLDNHIPIIEEITEDFIDEEYVDTIPTMEWVEKKLNEEFDWYSRDLFLLWVELGTLTNVSRQTSIPLNSVGRHINQIKNKLKKLWQLEQVN